MKLKNILFTLTLITTSILLQSYEAEVIYSYYNPLKYAPSMPPMATYLPTWMTSVTSVSMPSMPHMPTFSNVSMPTFTKPSFELPELRASSQAALIGGVAVAGLYGVHRYRKAYIVPSLEDINNSIAFVERLLHDPYAFHKENIRTYESVATIDTTLARQKEQLVRALGLTSSYINPKSYFSAWYQETTDDIIALFVNLKTFNSYAFASLKTRYPVESPIKPLCKKLYFLLLRARQAYDNTTLNQLVEKINAENYIPTEELRNSNKTFEIYYKIANARKNILSGPCDCTLRTHESARCPKYSPETALTETKRIEVLQSDLIYKLYGYRVWHIFMGTQKKNELNQLKNLFISYKKALFDTGACTPAEEQTTALLRNITQRLSQDDKWALVEDYIQRGFMFDLFAAPAAYAPAVATTTPFTLTGVMTTAPAAGR